MENFELEIEYRNEIQIFHCKLIRTGYTHKIEVDINRVSVLFEPDEENYCAVVAPESRHMVDVTLLAKLAEALEKAFK